MNLKYIIYLFIIITCSLSNLNGIDSIDGFCTRVAAANEFNNLQHTSYPEGPVGVCVCLVPCFVVFVLPALVVDVVDVDVVVVHVHVCLSLLNTNRPITSVFNF